MSKNLLPPKTGDMSDWYTTIIKLADLADYGPTKGSIIIKPYGYAIWELVQAELDSQIKKAGVSNAYFPLLIPASFLDKEKGHIDGFAPELAVVTRGGGEELEEPLVIRPTSETVIYNAYSDWIQSWRDLPLKINQWANIVRWEKRTMPFIRTSEFLWQEGHTAHATHEEAVAQVDWAMNMYAAVYRDFFAIDGYVGHKSSSERFAGAADTLSFESMMPSGKALQSCTSHDLGQNFSKAFNITFQNQQGNLEEVWQTSWGFSTRSLGALIIAHGDDNGLKLPPRIAPIQSVIVPAKETEEVMDYCRDLLGKLEAKGIRSKFDDRDDESFGFKLNKWEVKGVPTVLKVGPQEVEKNSVTVKRRDTLEESSIEVDGFEDKIASLLEEIQSSMLAASTKYQDENTRDAGSYDEFKKTIEEHGGFVRVHWNDNPENEKKIQDETKATSRCRLETDNPGTDFYTGEPANEVWLFAKSY